MWIYLVIINLITFCVFGFDKWQAINRHSRVRNATLLGLCFIGGALGGLLGMQTFRHKTRTWYYTIPVPIMLVVQIILIIYIMLRFSV